jgi:tetratricopeptide (TPR) repeat protein
MAEDYGVDNIIDFSKEDVRLSVAQTGDAWAQFMCGFAADQEGRYEEAVDWYEKAATNDNQRQIPLVPGEVIYNAARRKCCDVQSEECGFRRPGWCGQRI